MEVYINRLEETSISYEEIVSLMHDSFKERLDQGLIFTSCTMSVDEFKKRYSDGVIIVGFDKATNEMMAFYTFHLRADKKGIKYGYLEQLAVSPKAKRSGIGTKMLAENCRIAATMGAKYMLSDTACGAGDTRHRQHQGQLLHLPDDDTDTGHHSTAGTVAYGLRDRSRTAGKDGEVVDAQSQRRRPEGHVGQSVAIHLLLHHAAAVGQLHHVRPHGDAAGGQLAVAGAALGTADHSRTECGDIPDGMRARPVGGHEPHLGLRHAEFHHVRLLVPRGRYATAHAVVQPYVPVEALLPGDARHSLLRQRLRHLLAADCHAGGLLAAVAHRCRNVQPPI